MQLVSVLCEMAVGVVRCVPGNMVIYVVSETCVILDMDSTVICRPNTALG